MIENWCHTVFVVKYELAVGWMTEDGSVLSEGYGGMTGHVAQNSVGGQLRLCSKNLSDLEKFLHDERLVLWLVSSSTWATHPKVLGPLSETQWHVQVCMRVCVCVCACVCVCMGAGVPA